MSNRFALVLAAAVTVFVAADLLFGLGALLFLARRFVDLIAWVSFWR
ncbi:MAG: hypothetical protein ACK4KW_00885 [Gemmobacter sp.]